VKFANLKTGDTVYLPVVSCVIFSRGFGHREFFKTKFYIAFVVDKVTAKHFSVAPRDDDKQLSAALANGYKYNRTSGKQVNGEVFAELERTCGDELADLRRHRNQCARIQNTIKLARELARGENLYEQTRDKLLLTRNIFIADDLAVKLTGLLEEIKTNLN